MLLRIPKNLPAVATSTLVLPLDLTVTHTVTNLIAVGAFDLNTLNVLIAFFLAILADVSHL